MNLEKIILVLSAFLAISISLLDLSGLLDGWDIITKRIPIITLLIIGILITYTVFSKKENLENIESSILETQKLIIKFQEKVINKPFQGVDFFNSTDNLLSSITEETLKAKKVSTLNLSMTTGYNDSLDEYFYKVDNYIQKKDSPLKSFRSIASIGNYEKASFIIKRTFKLLKSGKFSSAYWNDVKHKIHIPIIGFHIVYQENRIPLIFFFPPISPSGIMDGFSIRNVEIARIMQKYFDIMWEYCDYLSVGKRIDKEGLENLANTINKLKDLKEYKELINYTKEYYE